MFTNALHGRAVVILAILSAVSVQLRAADDADPVRAALAKAEIPAIVRPGLRLVFYVASCNVPGQAYYRDDNGNWVDENGKFYSQTRGTGGHGCSQLDILAGDAKSAAVSVRAWSHHNATGPLYPLSLNGYAFAPDNTEWWMHPAALRDLPNVDGAALRIFRGPYKVLKTGKVFEKTVVIFRRSAEARVQRVYDSETGLLVHMDSTLRSPDGTTGVSRIDFVSQRAVELPWKGDAAPKWVADAKAMRYQGAVTMIDPRIPAAPMPLVARFSFASRHDTWALIDYAAQKQLPGGVAEKAEVQVVSGPNQVGGLWIQPDTLRKLQPGKVLDKDEALGTRVEVGPVGNGIAVINEIGALHNGSYGYDLSTGALSGFTTFNQATRNRVDVRLVQVEK